MGVQGDTDKSPASASEVERLRAELIEVRGELVAARHRAELAGAYRSAEHARLRYEIALSAVHFYAVADHYPGTIDRDEGAHARRILDLLRIVPLPQRDWGPNPQQAEEARLRTIIEQLYAERDRR